MSALRDSKGATSSSAATIRNKEPWDAVVVGAGPAGSLTALELARSGRRVLLLERASFPRWKVCGATLSPGARAVLRAAGLDGLLPSLKSRELGTLNLGGWALHARLSLAGSVAISRRALDAALANAAVEAGVTFLPRAGARLGPLLDDRRRIQVTADGEALEVDGRVVIAADGLKSALMAQAGVPSRPPERRGRSLIGLGAVFGADTRGYEAGAIHMAVGKAGYVGLVRVEDGSLNAAAALDPEALRSAGDPSSLIAQLLAGAGWPVPEAEPIQDWKGTPALTRRPRRVGAERLLAVGDASGYVEPFTGEGMFWALAGARALAPLASEVDSRWEPEILERWARIHRRLLGRAQRHCRALAWTLARPSLARNLLRILSIQPTLADPLIRRIGAPLPSIT